MKPLILCLLAVSVSTSAEEWVSVGAAPAVAPASSSATPATARTVVPSGNATATVTYPTSAAESDGASSELLNEMLMQVEQMQQEIALLRDQLEAQNNTLHQLRQDSDNRYLDLDRRMAFLTTESEKQQDVQTSQSPTVTDQDAYNAAMVLVRDKKFEEANKAFVDFIAQYPDSTLLANAWYWNGEIYLVRGEYEPAMSSFKTVMDRFPDSTKTPDASYKYAVTQHRAGDEAGARKSLEQVIGTYKDSAPAVVRLAQAYLKKLAQ